MEGNAPGVYAALDELQGAKRDGESFCHGPSYPLSSCCTFYRSTPI